jgi:hypothetical protein
MAVVSYTKLNLYRLSNRHPQPNVCLINEPMSFPALLHLLRYFVIASKLANLPLKSPNLLSHSHNPLSLLLSIHLTSVDQIHTAWCGTGFKEERSSTARRFFEVTLELVATFFSVRNGPMRWFIWYVLCLVTEDPAFVCALPELRRQVVIEYST